MSIRLQAKLFFKGIDFKSGWRPTLGWICTIALCYHYIVQPILLLILLSSGVKITIPAFDFSSLQTVLLAILGLGAMRTVEKVKGTPKNNQ